MVRRCAGLGVEGQTRGQDTAQQACRAVSQNQRRSRRAGRSLLPQGTATVERHARSNGHSLWIPWPAVRRTRQMRRNPWPGQDSQQGQSPRVSRTRAGPDRVDLVWQRGSPRAELRTADLLCAQQRQVFVRRQRVPLQRALSADSRQPHGPEPSGLCPPAHHRRQRQHPHECPDECGKRR
ncbi:hypothetical protein D3C86_1514220 [compost metagenome]